MEPAPLIYWLDKRLYWYRQFFLDSQNYEINRQPWFTIDFSGLINELQYIQHLKECLGHNKHSIRIYYIKEWINLIIKNISFVHNLSIHLTHVNTHTKSVCGAISQIIWVWQRTSRCVKSKLKTFESSWSSSQALPLCVTPSVLCILTCL